VREPDRIATSEVLEAERLEEWPRADAEQPTPAPEPGADEHVAPHPVVLVDPDAATLLAVWSLRRQGNPLHLLSPRRFEPALWARGVQRHLLPDPEHHPLAWNARLLELAAHLEPRPLLIPCSRRGRELLRASRPTLEPHYALAHLESLDLHGYDAEEFRTEKALRRTVLRGEPAFEVQLVVDAAGCCTGACILAWVAGVPPLVLVTSVEGEDVLERSLAWVRTRQLRGYARLIWGPDRFGRIDLQAAGTIPGNTWALAAEDGVDFPSLWAASLTGIAVEPRRAGQQLSRSFALAKPGLQEEAPLLSLRPPWSSRDPLPFLAGILRSFARS